MRIVTKSNDIIFDNLPSDILDICYSNIIYSKPTYLLNEIKLKAKEVMINRYIKKYINYSSTDFSIIYPNSPLIPYSNENILGNLFYIILNKWYENSAFNFKDFLDNDFEAVVLSVSTDIGDKEKIWSLEIYQIAIQLPINIIIDVCNK